MNKLKYQETPPLRTDLQDVLNTIFYEELDAITLGYRYGGMVITAKADRIPEKIRKLIYVVLCCQ